jgi:hypothetical protein
MLLDTGIAHIFCPPLNPRVGGVHSRAQHDGEETEARIVAVAATVRVGDRRERLDAMHCRVPPYGCSEAALMILKDENTEKPYICTRVSVIFLRP